MILFSIYENGSLRKVNKADFKSSKVYLIDDFKTVYLWFGSNSSKKKKDFAMKRANELIKKKKIPAKLQIINQNKEFGTFIAIKELLKTGLKENGEIEVRDELELNVDETLELISAGIEKDLEAEITLAADKLSKNEISYEDLSKQLAKLQLILLKSKTKPSEKEITKKTEEILKSSATYEELCWLVSELKILIKKKQIK